MRAEFSSRGYVEYEHAQWLYIEVYEYKRNYPLDIRSLTQLVHKPWKCFYFDKGIETFEKALNFTIIKIF